MRNKIIIIIMAVLLFGLLIYGTYFNPISNAGNVSDNNTTIQDNTLSNEELTNNSSQGIVKDNKTIKKDNTSQVNTKKKDTTQHDSTKKKQNQYKQDTQYTSSKTGTKYGDRIRP